MKRVNVDDDHDDDAMSERRKKPHLFNMHTKGIRGERERGWYSTEENFHTFLFHLSASHLHQPCIYLFDKTSFGKRSALNKKVSVSTTHFKKCIHPLMIIHFTWKSTRKKDTQEHRKIYKDELLFYRSLMTMMIL